MSPVLITELSALASVIDALHQATRVGLDTEFVRVSTFHPKPGLIQLALGDEIVLIDPLAGLDLAPLGQALNGPLCVLHAAQEDYEVLYRLTGHLPSQVFDTQVAYGLLAPTLSASLAVLCERLLERALDKGETRSDWTVRPLSASQCRYAAQDVEVLEALYQRLEQSLREAGRLAWMEEEMASIAARTERVLRDGDLETQVSKFGNAWRLSGRGMSRLVHLVQWREDTARATDRPRKHVLSDQSLFSLAAAGRIDRHHQLVSQHGLTDRQADRHGRALQAVFEAAEEAGELSPPPPPISKSQKEQMRQLQADISARADALHIAPELLVKKRHLVALVTEQGWSPQGWRASVLTGII